MIFKVIFSWKVSKKRSLLSLILKLPQYSSIAPIFTWNFIAALIYNELMFSENLHSSTGLFEGEGSLNDNLTVSYDEAYIRNLSQTDLDCL